MDKRNYIPGHLRETAFLAGKAGSFSNTPLRTVQYWTERGLVKPEISDTTGTGSKRLYSVRNCIEIAIIKSLAEQRMSLHEIKNIMNFLRRQTSDPIESEKPRRMTEKEKNEYEEVIKLFEEAKKQHPILKKRWNPELTISQTIKRGPECAILDNIISANPGFLVIKYLGDEKEKSQPPEFHAECSAENLSSVTNSITHDYEKLIIINITKIVVRILEKMG